MKFYIVILILLKFLIQREVYAQKKNITDSVWSGKISSEGLYQSGNTSKFFVQVRGEVKRESKELETILAASLGYGESKGKKDDNNINSAITADFFHKNIFSPFLLQYIEYNFAKGIDLRSQTGAGIKFTLNNNESHKLSVSAAMIYDLTNLSDKPGNYNSSKTRISFRLKTNQKFFDSDLIFSFTGFYQPALENFSNSNIRVDTGMEIIISAIIFAKVNYSYSFEDVVSVGRKRLDNKLTFGLGARFGLI